MFANAIFPKQKISQNIELKYSHEQTVYECTDIDEIDRPITTDITKEYKWPRSGQERRLSL